MSERFISRSNIQGQAREARYDLFELMMSKVDKGDLLREEAFETMQDTANKPELALGILLESGQPIPSEQDS